MKYKTTLISFQCQSTRSKIFYFILQKKSQIKLKKYILHIHMVVKQQ